MIEVKNLTKIYNFQKNTEVIALNDISLNFESTGLIFIVGKSGSGKSTLLNLLGGLDNYDSGEIKVRGKSTKDFNQNDFDSYRNTYMGFIFQEYNLLDELTVEKNIAIALELKGIRADSISINNLLKQVDLEGYGERTPCELSTGQKQRVAIARALIKSPDVILADEPTGALDSKTGRNLIKLLKMLSNEKLIIVVTHDRNLAEEYGDRIIELSDGEIIDDIKKQHCNNTDTLFNKIDSAKIEIVKPKLSFKISIIMGLRSLKRKRIRLFSTILLAAFAFILFGFTDSTMYKKSEMTLNSLYDSNADYISFMKSQYILNGNKEVRHIESSLSEEDILKLEHKFPNYIFTSVFKQYNDSINSYLYYDDADGIKNYYFNKKINGTIEITNDLMERYNLKLLSGRLPKEDNEILITKYTYMNFEKYEYNNNDIKVEVVNLDDMIGKSISLNGKEFKITGVIDTNFNEDRYQVLLSNKPSELLYDSLKKEIEVYLRSGLHSLIYVKEGYYNNVLNPKYTGIIEEGGKLQFYKPEDDSIAGVYGASGLVSNIINDSSNILWKDGIVRNELAENEIIIPIHSIPKDIAIGSIQPLDELLPTTTEELITEFANQHFSEIEDEFNYYGYYNYTADDYAKYIITHSQNEYHEEFDRDYFKETALDKLLNEVYLKAFESIKFLARDFIVNYEENVTVVGFYGPYETNYNAYPIIVSNNIFIDFLESSQGDYKFVLTKLSQNAKEDIELINFNNKIENNIQYNIVNEVTTIINYIDSWLDDISSLSFYAGIVVALFASVLLFNFISVSITNRKKEIGILRALGATSKNVFIIFLCESLIIATTIFILAFIGSFSISKYFNYYLRNKYNLLITLTSFGLRQTGLLFGISISVALISTYIPIKRFSSKKPIDVIKINN
ncbi:ABC transporter ATP-binding protein/permease [Mycoplasmatota bacterium]|nr:ABC transporter ATP-binding protein/permease [Mycoplasmatota bacterium]